MSLTKEERYIAIKQSHIDTEAETIFKLLLDTNNIGYQQEVIIGKFRVDFIINGSVYEINGGYHNTSKQRKKDKTRATYLLKRGYEITEITNQQVLACQKGLVKLEDLIKKDERCVEEKFCGPSGRSLVQRVRTNKIKGARNNKKRAHRVNKTNINTKHNRINTTCAKVCKSKSEYEVLALNRSNEYRRKMWKIAYKKKKEWGRGKIQ